MTDADIAARPRPWRAWVVVVLLGAAGSGVFAALHLPSPALFGFLFGALVYAVSGRGPALSLPARGSRLGQAIIGASMGAYVDLPTIRELAGDGVAIVTVCLGTLLLSIGAGRLLALGRGIGVATGVFAMIAGGASGITAVARELGADDRVVSVVQYLRVVIILAGMPLVTALVFRPEGAPQGVGPDAGAPAPPGADLAFTLVTVVAGLALARVVPFPSASLLGPLAVAVPIVLWGGLGAAGVPDAVLVAGYALIGLQVGLRFTAASLRAIARILPLAIGLIAALIAVCAGSGLLLAAWTGHTALDGYLATTPGGLYAVLATAADSGAAVTFVLAVQLVRLIVVLASAPLLAAWLRRRSGAGAGPGPG